MKHSSKQFNEGKLSATSSVYRADAGKFYGPEHGEGLGEKFMNVQEGHKPADDKPVDLSRMKRDTAAFMGADYNETES
jgi:hypothetical protein